MSTVDRDKPQHPPVVPWLHKDSRKVGPVPTASGMQGSDIMNAKHRRLARVLRIKHNHEAAKPQAKAFMFVTGILSLAVGVALIILAMPSELKGLYVMGSMGIIVAACSLLTCLYCTARDAMAWRFTRDPELVAVEREWKLSAEPVLTGTAYVNESLSPKSPTSITPAVPNSDHLYSSAAPAAAASSQGPETTAPNPEHLYPSGLPMDQQSPPPLRDHGHVTRPTTPKNAVAPTPASKPATPSEVQTQLNPASTTDA